MRISTVSFIAIAGLVCSVRFAEAQRRPAPPRPAPTPVAVPTEPSTGIGASVGPSVTSSQYLNNGFDFDAHVERFVARRVAIRGQFGSAGSDIVGLSYAGTLKPMYFLGNVVYNWQRGVWRPYVTGGGGVYRYSFEEAGVKGSRTNGGMDGGGGIEYFFMPGTAITAETLLHMVDNVPTNRATLGFKGSFWTFSIGAKKYF
jgi:hypothetical protein